MKTALVLAGGGTKGAYQNGIITALREIGRDDWNIVTGTSVGALNAALVVQKDFDALQRLYDSLSADMFINGFVPNDMSIANIVKERKEFFPSLKSYLKEGGIDVTPFYNTVDEFYDPEKFFASPVDFGCITALAKDHTGVYVTKEMMKENGRDWLIASASAYPAFPVKVINGEEYVDGGYFDNLPIDYALRKGADDVTAIDLSMEPIHPQYIGRDHIHYIFPHEEMYNFLDFDQEKLQHAQVIGHHDAFKAFHIYEGWKYTFKPSELPAFFDSWYLSVMMLEEKIRIAGAKKNVSSQYITDSLKEQMKRPFLRTKDYYYGMMDALMTMCGFDTEEVYARKEAEDRILAYFADAAQEEFDYAPSLSIKSLTSYLKKLKEEDIVKALIHHNLYPEHEIFSENLILTVYPFEQSLADFVTCAMKALVQ